MLNKFLAGLCAALFTALPALADPIQLALNWKAEPQFGGFYAARVHGLYAQNHLDVNVVEGGSGTPTVQMLAAGKVNYAIVAGDELVIARARGAGDVVALFATFQTSPQAIMTHAERGFTGIEQVMKSDGVLLWQAGLPYAQFFAKKYAPLTVKTAPYLGGIGNFQNDPMLSQQCFLTSEPLTAARAGIKTKTFLIAEGGYNPYTTVLVTTRAHLQKNPEEVRRLVDAVRRGWEHYLNDPAPTNRKMAELNKAMDAQTFEDSARAQVALIKTPQTRRLGEMTTARWQTLIDQLSELKIIRNAVAAQQVFVDL